MKPPVEKEISMVALTGDTPQDIANHYVKVMNDAFLQKRAVYSRHLKDMTGLVVSCSAIVEIKGMYFAEIEWCITETEEPEQETEEE